MEISRTQGIPRQHEWKFYSILSALLRHRELLARLTWHELISRYKGSILGLAWSVLNPLLMLAVYFLVFGVIFQAKWDVSVTDSRAEFALGLYCGIIVFGVFSETLLRSPHIITANSNYVKKVVFPLEILPATVLGASLLRAVIELFVLFTACILFIHRIPWTALALPLILLPLLLISLGTGLLLSALGVFIRDIGNAVVVLSQALFFMTPVCYPLSVVPEPIRTFIRINPLCEIVDSSRNCLVLDRLPTWGWYFLNVAIAFAILQLGCYFFEKSRRTFSDVL